MEARPLPGIGYKGARVVEHFRYAPTAGEVLAKALEIEPKTFKQWTARGVSSHLKRYGLITHKSCGRKVYGRVTLDELRVIQDHYAVDLGLDDESAGT